MIDTPREESYKNDIRISTLKDTKQCSPIKISPRRNASPVKQSILLYYNQQAFRRPGSLDYKPAIQVNLIKK